MLSTLDKAQGCLIGLLAGDNFGNHTEFMSSSNAKYKFPNGLTTLMKGGVHRISAGQPTDDGELALTLALSIIQNQGYDPKYTRKQYKQWAKSDPFDIGTNTYYSLNHDSFNSESLSNGSLMRIAPIGIYGSSLNDLDKVGELAILDSECTHDNPIVAEVNSIFAKGIALAISSDLTAKQLLETMTSWATEPAVQIVMANATKSKPKFMDGDEQGCCLIAFQNALYHLYKTDNITKAFNATLLSGGDADTNCAILGALFGAVYGLKSIPDQWIQAITTCTPDSKSMKPRPKEYWPNNALSIAYQLISLKD